LVSGLAALLLLGTIKSNSAQSAGEQARRYLTGRLLVAAPGMRDPRFAETVIYMITHNEKGAMGVVVNRPLARGPISDLLKSLGVEGEEGDVETVLYYGGPVELETGFILHTTDYMQKGTQIVGAGIALTTDVEILRALAHGKGPRRSLVIMGYAGWGPGQLEAEIRRNDWFSIPAEESLIFDEDWKTKWKRANDKRRIKT
jgi:putative transcriptional regulator